MLAYNYRKYANRLDPVREILAKLDAKQTKTGLSLYHQDHHSSPEIAGLNKTGSSPKLQEDAHKKDFFPNPKAARKKAQDRITARDQTDKDYVSIKRQTRMKKIPHRLPQVSQIPHPISRSIDRHDDRLNQPYTIPDTQFDKDNIDININPFGYNRRTLAFDERNINYVVEWPETWPFKIMSFQEKSKQAKRKPKRINRPKDAIFSPPIPRDTQGFPWKEPTHPARVLAPVDHPTKPPVFPTRPFVESAAKRNRKIHSKKGLRKIVLTSRERELHFSSGSGDPLEREDIEFVDLGKGIDAEDDDQKPYQKPETERVDSVPPSTPVPEDLPNEDNRKEPEDEVKVHQEAQQVLKDIVDQIITEDQTPI